MKKITTGCAFTAHYEELEKFKEFVKTKTRFNFSEAIRYLIEKALKDPNLLKQGHNNGFFNNRLIDKWGINSLIINFCKHNFFKLSLTFSHLPHLFV